MRWPWVSRTELDTQRAHLKGEVRALELELREQVDLAAGSRARAEFLERRLTTEMLRAEIAEGVLQAKLDACEAERKMLLDRIVVMSGQAALYERQGTAEKPVLRAGEDDREAEGYRGPAPAARLTSEDLHRRFKQAEAEGKLGYVAPAGARTVN